MTEADVFQLFIRIVVAVLTSSPALHCSEVGPLHHVALGLAVSSLAGCDYWIV
jgi:hypothetical protein